MNRQTMTKKINLMDKQFTKILGFSSNWDTAQTPSSRHGSQVQQRPGVEARPNRDSL